MSVATATSRSSSRSAWGATINGAKTYKLHRGQTDVLRHPARFKAAVAGTGGGKTAIGPIFVMQQISKVLKGGRDLIQFPILGMVIAPTYDVLARATAPTLVNAFAGTDLEGVWIPSRRQYILPDGMGIIWLLSADRPMGLEGGQFDFCWADEGGQLKYDAWVAIQGRLGLLQAPCLITTTPYAQNWLYHKFYMLAKAGDRDYYVRQWRSIDNPAYPKEEYDRAHRTLSPQRAAMRYDGEFVKMAGLCLPDLSACVHGFDAAPAGTLEGGVDWGWSPDPFACIASVVDAKGDIWFWYERYMKYQTIGQHAAAIPKGVMYWADASNPEGIAQMRRAGHACRPNQVKGVQLGLDLFNERIYERTLHIHPCLTSLIMESGQYRYPEKDDEVQGDDPIGLCHAIDAGRYLIANHDRHKVRQAGVAA